ncbi:MAG: hypothetical protein AB7T49_03855 [Oligoflexales bacterium]
MLGLINTMITTGNEYVLRTVMAPLTSEHSSYAFFVTDQLGSLHINRQSLTNILMTAFASIFGGPVYFMTSARNRILFFLAFGFFNSYISQCISSIVRDGTMSIAYQRLMFDLAYMATFKVLIFELGRRPILKARGSFYRVGTVRVGQDFCTTAFKVLTLNILGLKG